MRKLWGYRDCKTRVVKHKVNNVLDLERDTHKIKYYY